MMPRTRNPYLAELREQLVALVRSGRSVEDLALRLCDHSRRPFRSPLRTTKEMEAAAVSVRRWHPVWGGRKNRAVLLRQVEEIPDRLRERTGIAKGQTPKATSWLSRPKSASGISACRRRIHTDRPCNICRFGPASKYRA